MEKSEKRYVAVARQLWRSKEHTASKILAQNCEMNVAKFRCSTQRAKEFLAAKGFFMENKVNKKNPKDGTGYRRTDDIDVLRRECDKSINRAKSHIAQTVKILSLLQRSGRWDNLELAGIKAKFLSSLSKIEDVSTPDDWTEFQSQNPDFLNEVPDEDFIPPED